MERRDRTHVVVLSLSRARTSRSRRRTEREKARGSIRAVFDYRVARASVPVSARRARTSDMSGIGSGYDLSTTTYSPDGRVFQVEYAGKAVDAAV